MSEEWLENLKAACDAGYYRTEVSPENQTGFPWQNFRCRDCPFWLQHNICQIDLAKRDPDDPPCRYFDPPDHLAGKHLVGERLRLAWLKQWKWQPKEPRNDEN